MSSKIKALKSNASFCSGNISFPPPSSCFPSSRLFGHGQQSIGQLCYNRFSFFVLGCHHPRSKIVFRILFRVHSRSFFSLFAFFLIFNAWQCIYIIKLRACNMKELFSIALFHNFYLHTYIYNTVIVEQIGFSRMKSKKAKL